MAFMIYRRGERRRAFECQYCTLLDHLVVSVDVHFRGEGLQATEEMPRQTTLMSGKLPSSSHWHSMKRTQLQA